MEAWLSKTKVLAALCAVMFLTALQHGDLMVYGIFVFMTLALLLGLVLPWWSMRGMQVAFEAIGADQAREGEGCDLHAWVERRSALPACLVTVEAHWSWAGHRITLRQCLPWVRPGRHRLNFSAASWPSRGRYQLSELTLACAFPMGLRPVLRRVAIEGGPTVSVRPREGDVPVSFGATETEAWRGAHALPRHATSEEVASLRPYESGDDPRHMNWPASARAGELIIQRMQARAEQRLRLIVALPDAAQIGRPQAPAEEAVRVAMTLLARARDARMLVDLLLPVGDGVQTYEGERSCVQALSDTPARRIDLATFAHLALAEVRAGMHVVFVLPHDLSKNELQEVLAAIEGAGLPRSIDVILATTGPGLDQMAPGWTTWARVQA